MTRKQAMTSHKISWALRCFVVAFAFLTPASAAQAQTSTWGDVAISAVGIDYDLSGTGRTAGLAGRITRDLTEHLVLEGRALFAKPNQQFGPSTLFLPEVQLHHRWSIARFTPYAGGGIGTAAVFSDLGTDWDPTLSVAGGTGIRLTPSLGLIGEMRLRGIEWRFTGSTAEWSAGLAWRLPRW